LTAPSKALSPAVRQAAATSAQAALWFLSQLDPASSAGNLCRCFDIRADLRLDALQAAWRGALERHPMLRVTLADEGGRLWQRIGEPGEESVSFLDLAHADPAEADRRAERACAEQAARPFELGRGPLARLVILELGDQRYRLLITAHRAVADERSMSVLTEEISAGYTAAIDADQVLDGCEPDDLGLAVSPRRELLDWWTDRLEGYLPALELPLDRTRPDGPASAAGTVEFDWGRQLGGAVDALGATDGISAGAVLLAAFQVLLHRYSGEDRIVLGMATSSRPPEAGNRIGPFGNLVLLKGVIEPTTSFRHLAAAADRTLREALEHRALPFDELVRALDPARDPRRLPLCDVLFGYSEEQPAPLRLAGAEVSELSVANGGTTADLDLRVTRAAGSLAGTLTYRSAVLERISVKRMVEQLHSLLTAALAQPELAVAALPLDSPDRLRTAERAADQLTAAVPAGRSIHSMVAHRAGRSPDAVAVVTAAATLTYRQLQDEVDRLAAYLRGLGGIRARAVAVRVTPGPLQLVASLAVLQAGGHLVWFGIGDAGERSRAVLADLEPRCLLLDHPPADDALARWYRDELHGSVLDLTDLQAYPGDRGAPEPADETGLDQWAYVAYTSGSTGRPKGIAQSHGAFGQFISWMAEEFRIRPGCRIAQWAAPEHDPSICEVFATLAAGGTLYPVPERIRAHPEKLAAWLEDNRITFLQTVPSFARELLKVIGSTGTAGPLALEHLLLMGEALPGDLVNGLRAALPSTQLANVYGPTETIAATWHQVTGPVHGASTPIGRVIPGRQVLVLDEYDRPCPAGVTGEIVIRSPYVTPGYVGAGAADRSAFRPVPGTDAPGIGSYRSGDLARWRFDGALEFRGRRDFQVKLFGTRVELTDIEAALAEHDSVAECAVVAIADRDGLVVRLAAYVVPRAPGSGGPAGSVEVWRSHLRRRFGASMVPASFTVLADRLPRNVGGKVDRRRLPSPPAPATGRALTPVELALAEIWTALLGTRDLGPDDTFFAAGGHSLLMPQLVHRIRGRFGVEIPLWECGAHPSLAAMSTLISTATATAADGDGDQPGRPPTGHTDRDSPAVPAQAN